MAQDVNVVVVFYSRTGRTEQLALNAGVGVVQARGNLRLRRLPEVSSEAAIATIPSWAENHQRMNREYIAPREQDALWADAIITGIPVQFDVSSAETKAWWDWLAPLGRQGKLEGKLGAAFVSLAPQGEENSLGESILASLHAAMAHLGLIVAPFGNVDAAKPFDALRTQGRRVTELARKLKTEPEPAK